MRHFSSRAILGPQVSRNTSRGSQRAPHTILRCQMSALRQRPSLFLGGPEKGKQDKELVTNLEKTSYEAKMIPCPGTCSQKSQDRGSTPLRKRKVPWQRQSALALWPQLEPRKACVGPASTAREASPGGARPGQPLQGSWQGLLLASTRRGAARPSRAPSPLYRTKTPSSLTMVFRQCSVLVYLVGGWEEVGWGLVTRGPKGTHHACTVRVLCVCCACAVRVLCVCCAACACSR